MTGAFIREKMGKFDHTETQGEDNLKTEAEIGVMLLQGREWEEPPEAGGGKERFSF